MHVAWEVGTRKPRHRDCSILAKTLPRLLVSKQKLLYKVVEPVRSNANLGCCRGRKGCGSRSWNQDAHSLRQTLQNPAWPASASKRQRFLALVICHSQSVALRGTATKMKSQVECSLGARCDVKHLAQRFQSLSAFQMHSL